MKKKGENSNRDRRRDDRTNERKNNTELWLNGRMQQRKEKTEDISNENTV